MDVSELRKRILRALDEARKEAATRRQVLDAAARDYERFLSQLAVPLVRQAATVLNASGHAFSVHTPAGAVRLAAEASPQTFLEFTLDPSPLEPTVLGRISLTRGRQGLVLVERPVTPGKAIAELTEEDVSAFLVAEIPKLVVRQ
jgi:hypothetical protein